jgi:protease I
MAELANSFKVAFLTANSGVEQVELTTPWQAVKDAGGEPVLLAPKSGEVKAFHHDVEPGDSFDVDITVDAADPSDYAALVLPGGTTNPDALRLETAAVDFVKAIAKRGTPIAAICHGPWTLVEAGLVADRQLTSWPSLRTDITNAGGTWVDVEVQTDTSGGFPLVTSRKPDDLDAFCAALLDQISG